MILFSRNSSNDHNQIRLDYWRASFEKSSKDRACAQATASLEKTYDNGSGGWLVSCAENQDFWVLIPAQAKQAAIALPCILARATTGTDCYANIRTMSPDDLARCESGKPTADRAIRSCSAILQSGRLDANPSAKAQGYGLRALVFSGIGLTDLAVQDFDRALALDSKNILNSYNRGVVLVNAKRYDQSMTDFNRALAIDPNHWPSLYYRRYAHLKTGKPDKAIADFDHVLRLKPGYDDAMRNRAEALKAKGTPKP